MCFAPFLNERIASTKLSIFYGFSAMKCYKKMVENVHRFAIQCFVV